MIQSIDTYEDLFDMGNALIPFYKKMPYAKKKPNPERFAEVWGNFVESGVGKVIALKEDDTIIGGIGLLTTPALEDGVTVTQEAFWYIDESKRGKGLRLFKEAEKYAHSVGSERFYMVHLEHSMPHKLKKFYEKLGFKKIETGYIKEI